MSLGKLLYITPDGFDTPTPNNQLIETLLCDVLDNGIEVHMVAGNKGGPLPDVPGSLAGRKGFSCSIVPRGSVDKTDFVSRFFYELVYVGAARRAWRPVLESCDCVLMQSCHLAAFHIAALRRRTRKPIAFNEFEVFPDNVRETLGELPYRIFKTLQGCLNRRVNLFIVPSEDMRDTVVGQGVPSRKVAVVPNWYDDSVVREVEPGDNRFLKKYHVDTSKFIVQFAGSFGYVFDYRFVIGVAELLRDRPDIEFHMIGRGTRLDEFEHEAETRNLDSIKFFPWQPIEEISDVYSASSIGLVPLEAGVIYSGNPSKSALLMACGRAVIFSLESGSRFFKAVNDGGIGYAVERGDVSTAAALIRRLADDPVGVLETSRRAREYARERLSRSACTRRFIRSLKKVTEE